MSLVNEALRRARTQAALQQAGSGPLAHLRAPVAPPSPRVSLPAIVIGVGVGCVIVGIACGILFYQARQYMNMATRPVAPAKPAARVSDVQPRVSLPAPPVTPVVEAKSASVAVETPAAPAIAETPPARSEPTVISPASVATAPAGLVDGKVYLQAIDLPDAPKVKLDGILWSDKKPLALINGMTAAPGDDLGEMKVVTIEPKRVKLAAQGKEFFVRLP